MNAIAIVGLVVIGMAASTGVTIIALHSATLGLLVAAIGVVIGSAMMVVGVLRHSALTAPKKNPELLQQLAAAKTPVAQEEPLIDADADGGYKEIADDDFVVGEATETRDYIPVATAVALPGLGTVYERIQTGQITGYLLVVGGPDRGRGIELSTVPVTIGRGEGNLFRLRDTSVSSNQASISIEGGRAVVRDAKSKNGTFLNDKRITTEELKNCDVLGFGATKILLTLGD
ncbi:FHA domain-containing protein [Planctomycetota bacterium]